AGCGRIAGVDRIEACALLIGMAGSAAFAAGLLWLLWGSGLPKALVVFMAVVFAFLPSLVDNPVSGMETPRGMALMAANFAALRVRRPILFGLTAGLLILSRIDTAVWLACVAVAFLMDPVNRTRRRIVSAAGAAAFVVCPWLWFAASYFGTVVPQSVVG